MKSYLAASEETKNYGKVDFMLNVVELDLQTRYLATQPAELNSTAPHQV